MPWKPVTLGPQNGEDGERTRREFDSLGRYLAALEPRVATLEADSEAFGHVERQVVGVGGVASVTFNAPNGGRHLRLVWQARNTSSTTVLIQFNGDTGNTYNWNLNRVIDGATNNSSNSNTNGILFQIASAEAASVSGTGEARIPNYDGTLWQKTAVVTYGYGLNTPKHSAVLHGSWESAAAITSLQAVASAGVFVEGSTFDLYVE